jgi:uncharacterized membrane protein
MTMAETQAAHRMKLEERVVENNISSQKRGSIFAFILGMTGISGGFWLIANGKSTEGLTSLISSLVALAGIFIIGRTRQEKERQNKIAPKT